MPSKNLIVFPSFSQMLLIYFIVFILSLVLTDFMRRFALQRKIIDIPNDRSMHKIAMPRGGGIAIVITFSIFILVLSFSGFMASSLVCVLVGGGLCIAGIGYCDDVYTLKARTRILIHFGIAILALYLLGGFPLLDLGSWTIILPAKGYFLGVIGIVWSINLYNFMDGIDGLAGSEGLFVAIAGSIALTWVGDMPLALTLGALAAAIAGFTVWNWPPAKIFLGDVGSGYLGYIFAVLAIHTANRDYLTLNVWILLLAVFLSDATFTLIYRGLQGKPLYFAHREHAYQHLIAFGASHKKTVLSIVMINMLMLLPLASAAVYWPRQSFWFMASAITLLFSVWFTICHYKS